MWMHRGGKLPHMRGDFFSQAPCMNAFETMDEACYRVTIRAIRRAIETCGILGIPRIVVHASFNSCFTTLDFYRQNFVMIC